MDGCYGDSGLQLSFKDVFDRVEAQTAPYCQRKRKGQSYCCTDSIKAQYESRIMMWELFQC